MPSVEEIDLRCFTRRSSDRREAMLGCFTEHFFVPIRVGSGEPGFVGAVLKQSQLPHWNVVTPKEGE